MRLQNAAFGSIIPFTEETGGESHTPYITLNDDGTASVLVGKVGGDIHPMIASDDPEVVHWITEIYVQQNGDHVIAMSSLDPTGVNNATMNFNIPEGTETLRAFAWW
jgi:desulfoferrodoxin (superoxide reductase-like protein)